MLPRETNFPDRLDDDYTLYHVKDALRVKLGRDFNPGDSKIYADEPINKFPSSGIITLVDKHDPKNVVSMHYGAKEEDYFTDLEILPDSNMSYKAKEDTLITQQVMAEHHRAIKDSIFAIQKYVGTIKDNKNDKSLYSRINSLKQIVFKPFAWFEANKTKGILPLTVTFTSRSNGIVGPIGDVTYEWDFGDGEKISDPHPEMIKTYDKPGKYNVKLRVINDYGEDEITFHNMIDVIVEAPEEAIVEFKTKTGQTIMEDGRLRTPVNQFVNIEIPQNKDELRAALTYGGEHLDLGTMEKLDPITSYTWQMSDDIPHENSPNAKAIYSIGGLNDITLRVDTQSGAYRITNFKDKIDVVENNNLWLWTFNNIKSVSASEFGLFSETFKAKASPESIYLNPSFLMSSDTNKSRQMKEFMRNNGFAKKNNISSGSQGKCLLYWASGRSLEQSTYDEKINFKEYNAFSDTYITPPVECHRPWNWASFNAEGKIYFLLGNIREGNMPSLSMTNKDKDSLDLSSLSVSSDILFKHNYLNGAQELQHNKSEFNSDGEPIYGHFSSYRTTWCNGVGYMVRNSGVGENHYMKSFYKTEGTIGKPFLNIERLPDVPGGSTKECQIVALNDSVYLFKDSGSVLSYNNYRGTWESIGQAGESLITSKSQSFLACSNSGRKAYLSFDHNKMFLRFNELTLNFTTLNTRPDGDQWLMEIY